MSEKSKLIASAQKHLQKGQLGKAIKEFRRLVELDPRDIRTRQKLAELCSRNKDTEGALAEYEAVAKYYSENGFYLKSIAVYKQMQRIDPSQPTFYLRLAELNEKQNLIGNALKEYQHLVAHYEKNQMTSEAIDILQKMKDLDPENLNVAVKVAECYAKSGFKDKAREVFTEVCEQVKEKGEYAKVIKLCGIFAPFFPGDQEISFQQASAQVHLGETDIGIAGLLELQQGMGSDAQLLRVLALGYQRSGDYAKQCSTLESLLLIEPKSLPDRCALIDANLTAGRDKQALLELEQWKDALFDADQADFLKARYERLQEKLSGNDQVVTTLHAIYEATGEGDKLFDLMSAGDAPVSPDASPEPEETLVDDLLGDALEEIEDLGEADLLESGAPIMERPAAPAEPNTGEAVEAQTAEVPLGFLDQFAAEDQPVEPPGLAEAAIDEAAPGPSATVQPEPSAADEPTAELDLGDLELELELELDEDNPVDLTPASVVEEPLEDAVEEVVPIPEPMLEEAELLDEEPALGADLEGAEETEIDALVDSLADTSVPADPGWEESLPRLLGNHAGDLAADDAESHYNLGIAYKEMGLMDDAINEFSQAMRYPARLLDCLLLKGICLVEKQQFADAAELFRVGLLYPELDVAEKKSLLFELGLLHEAQGNLDLALQNYRQVSEIDHFFRDVGQKLSRLQESLGLNGDGPGDGSAGEAGKSRVSYL